MLFHITLEHAEDGWIVAECPALPGCVSQGETLQELQANVREAMTGYLEVLHEEGRKPEEIQVLEIVL